MTLLYESLTYILFGGEGIRGFFSDAGLAVFGRVPGVFVPAVLAIAVFVIYNYFTTAGRRGKILSNNQSAGVNIGINENKDVVVSYVFSGLIIGLAAIGMEIMNYGLNCMNLGAGGWQQIILGAFVLGFYTFSAQSGKITAFFEKRKRKAEQV